MPRLAISIIVIAVIAISSKQRSVAQPNAEDVAETKYLTFQVWPALPGYPGIPPVPGRLSLSKTQMEGFVRDVVKAIGTRGDSRHRLGFAVGPFSFDVPDEETRQWIRDAFAVARENDVAVAFHIDDSMSWGERKDLLSNPDNIEAADWKLRPSTGRRLDWGPKPTKFPPQMCFNSPAIQAAVQKRASIIGAEIKQEMDALKKSGNAHLFACVIAGSETQIGRDFETNRPLGYRALKNRGFSETNPPTDPDRDRVEIVKEFMELWANSLQAAGVPREKVFCHIAFTEQGLRKADARESYAEKVAFGLPEVAFSSAYRPGFSTYPEGRTFKDIYAVLEKHGWPGWISAEGTNVSPTSMPGEPTMETYLGRMFNHGAVMTNIVSWGIGGEANRANFFREATENSEALAAYAKFLRGEKLVESATGFSSEAFQAKMRRIQTELPVWVQRSGQQAKVQPLIGKLGAFIKGRKWQEADKVADEVLSLLSGSYQHRFGFEENSEPEGTLKTRSTRGSRARQKGRETTGTPSTPSDPGMRKSILATRLSEAPPPKPHTEEIADQRPGEPPLKKMPEGDASSDAAGRGQLFESICVPGVTDHQQGMNGFALADLNRDGWLDLVAACSPARGTRKTGARDSLRICLNRGDFRFEPHQATLRGSKVALDSLAGGQVPNLADFNGDGFLDIFVTRGSPMLGGVIRGTRRLLGNSFFLSDGTWDRFRDVSESMGIRNEKAYNRQPAFGDVNRDGWLDIAVGCDNIKNAQGGFPHSRLYVYQPAKKTFEDIGGTELVPDFGGFYDDPDKDKACPDINLIDLDNDGDLDLLQVCHVDVMELEARYTPIEYRQGVFCWKNLLSETGKLQYEKVTGNGLACEARLRYNRDTKTFQPEGKAPGLPYTSFADTDNDGDLDVLAVGPGTPSPLGFAPRTEYAGGRFWRNLGNFQFEVATEEVGLTPVTWTYGKWMEFFDAPLPRRPRAPLQPKDRFPYYSDAMFGDFDNDGWQDVVVMDRSESSLIATRAALFMNRGDGTFELKPTTFSGLDDGGIAGEAADLNNDGLLDLVFAQDPDNTGVATSMAGYESRIYWNTGLHGAKANHWLRFRFSGVTDAQLLGARIELTANGKNQYRWIQSSHAYKSGSPLEAHFGLGKDDAADVAVILPTGNRMVYRNLKADEFLDLNLKTGGTDTVR